MTESDLSPLSLAYLGDAVFEVMVRERLIRRCSDAAACNREALSYVTSSCQARAAKKIKDRLTPEEEAVFYHARNAKPHSVPQNADPYDYRLATGLEALFAWLYIRGEKDRMIELFDLAFPEPT